MNKENAPLNSEDQTSSKLRRLSLKAKLHIQWANFPIRLYTQLAISLSINYTATQPNTLIPGYYSNSLLFFIFIIYSRFLFNDDKKTKWIGKIIYSAFHQLKILYAKHLSKLSYFIHSLFPYSILFTFKLHPFIFPLSFLSNSTPPYLSPYFYPSFPHWLKLVEVGELQCCLFRLDTDLG